MGNALIAMVVAEECLTQRNLRFAAARREIERLEHAWGGEPSKPERVHVLDVPHSAVWEPEREPLDLDWHKDPKKRRLQMARNRRSLERFLNRALEGLDGMVRSGWWILGKARVRVAEMHGVPPGLTMAQTALRGGQKRRPKRAEPEREQPEPVVRCVTLWGLDQKGKRVRSATLVALIDPNTLESVIDTATAHVVGGYTAGSKRRRFMGAEIKVLGVPACGLLRRPVVVSDALLKRADGVAQMILGHDHIGRTPLASLPPPGKAMASASLRKRGPR